MKNLQEYEKLKTNLLLLNSEGAMKAIMISSSTMREGTSTVASNLAVTLAKTSTMKIVLVDGNLRHPTLHNAFNLKNTFGLSDLVVGNIELEDGLRETKQQNLLLISAGNSNVNPIDILESCKLKSLVAQLRNEYDYVIFDSAPINVYSDGSILSRQVDGIILVVRAGKIRREVVQNAKEQLQRADANIIGIVLNRKEHVIPKFLYRRL